MIMKTEIIKDIMDYIAKNKEDFEIGKFEGDIFWYNHMVFSKVDVALNIVFFNILLKNFPGEYWMVSDLNFLDKAGRKLYKRYKDAPQLLKQQFNERRDECDKCFQDLIACSFADKKLYVKFAKSAEKLGAFSVFSFEALERFLGKLIEQQIINRQKREILTFPLYTSYIQKANEELLAIIKSIPCQKLIWLKKGGKKIHQHKQLLSLLDQYNKKWGWAYTNYGSHKLPTAAEILKKASELRKNLKEELKIEQKILYKKQKKQALLKKTSKELNNLIFFLDLLTELRDQRKAFWIQLVIPFKDWLKKFAEYHQLSFNEIQWLTWQEQRGLNKNNRLKLLKIINKRKNNCLAIYGYEGKESIIFTGDDAKNLADAILASKQKDVLKGIPAQPGKAVGKAIVIKSTKEFSKFQKGSILAVSHTTPDYVPIMKKAKAILTERGGITCHAAIVSRELAIPCVVGINGLINSLKNNDLIEVDADRGIIKIIKN